MKNRSEKGGLVYSTNPSYKIEDEENMDGDIEIEPGKQDLRVYLERKNRGGKEVTVIKGYKGSVENLEVLCKELKGRLGTGGSVKDGEILIQGDKRERVMVELRGRGYRARN
jgi:translation initiation factor 1